jgi:hypothetical protein
LATEILVLKVVNVQISATKQGETVLLQQGLPVTIAIPALLQINVMELATALELEVA